jgi:hypothetical protein
MSASSRDSRKLGVIQGVLDVKVSGKGLLEIWTKGQRKLVCCLGSSQPHSPLVNEVSPVVWGEG